jgi:plastocyanin
VKKLSALIAAAGVLAAVGVPIALAGTKSVTVGDDYYVRKGGTPTVTINHGSSIKWVWRGKRAHNVYQLSGPKGTHFHSPTKVKGTFTRKFGKAGNYVIVCTVHPGMEMKIKVK